MKLTDKARRILIFVLLIFIYCAICGYFLSLANFNFDLLFFTYSFIMAVILIPFFRSENLLSPICLYSAILILQLSDFALQNAISPDLRYYSSLPSGITYDLRLSS